MSKKHPGRITAKQIGEMVGCCQQAVSCVLSGRGNSKVSVEKRERILEIARNFGYSPSVSARSLAGRSTKTIGVIPECSRFCASIQLTLSTALRARGYETILIPLVTHSDAEERHVLGQLQAYGVDGIISLNKKGDFRQELLPVPSVLVSYENYDVDMDWSRGFALATEHLLSHGHRRIGFLRDIRQYCSRLMVRSYRETMAAAGLDCPDSWLTDLLWNADFGSQLLRLLEKEGVTGFLCSSDMVAGRFMVWLRQHGYRVPEDIAVVGYMGETMGETMTASLTSVVYPLYDISTAAVDMLMDKLGRGLLARIEEPRLIAPRLHLGHSCGCAERPMKLIWWEGIDSSYERLHRYQLKQPPKELLDH